MIDAHAVRELLNRSWEGDFPDLVPVSGGLDSNAWNYRSGEWFIKVRSTEAHGLEVPFELFSSGIHEISAPVLSVDRRLSAQFDGHFVSVYSFFSGSNGFERPLSPTNWDQLGRALRRVHATPLPMPESSIVDFDYRKWDQFEDLRGKLTSEEMLDFLESKFEELEWIHQTIRELGRECYEKDENFCVCHGDIHIGNVLATDEEIRIVDWDQPRFAPKECDLMFFLGGGIMGHEPWVEESFKKGYGDFELDPNALSFFRFERLFDDVLAFMEDVMNPRYSDAEKLESVRLCKMLFEPGYLFDVAQRGYSTSES